MSELDRFNRLISKMSPVQFATSDSGNPEVGRFKIFTFKDEPFIETLFTDPAKVKISMQERKLYEEIKRINDGNDIFGITASSGIKAKASLWDHPYLINMMKGLNTIVDNRNIFVKFDDSLPPLILKITLPEKSETADMQLCLRTEDGDKRHLVFLDDTHVMDENIIYDIRTVGYNYSTIHSLVSPIEKQILDSYLTLFLSYVSNLNIELNGEMARKIATPEHAVPTLFLEKVATDKALYLRTGISLDSLDTPLQPGFQPSFVARIESNNNIRIHPVEGCDINEKTSELKAMITSSAPNRQAKKDVYHEGNFFIVPAETAGPFLLKYLPQVLDTFRLVGSEKLREYKVVAAKPRLNMKFSSGIDFLEGDGDIEIGEETFSIADFLKQYASKKYVQLSDGNRGIIDDTYIRRLQRIFRRRDKNGKIKVNLFDLPEIEDLLESKLTGRFAARSRSVLEGFNELKDLPNPPYKVNASLRPYQDEGVKWMKYLYDNKLGGCLADDMGLGKTLQTIALLTMIYPKGKLPTLIIMPRSLLFNWEKELTRFSPKLKFHTYYGPERNLEEALKSKIILTTYGMVRNDILKLKEYRFECVILDESQNIKNISAQTTMAVQVLDTVHRFALSGTPIENNLTELYSLFRFLNPTMFGSFDDFNASYTIPVQKYGDKDATRSLRQKIFPFILRRLKKDVLKDLPPRIDKVIYVEMSEKQKKLYNETRMQYKEQINETIAREGVKKTQFMMLQAMTELRRIASVPESI